MESEKKAKLLAKAGVNPRVIKLSEAIDVIAELLLEIETLKRPERKPAATTGRPKNTGKPNDGRPKD